MQAAIGCAQLKKLQLFIKKRKDNFDVLYGGLSDTKKYFLLPQGTAKSQPCWFGFILTLKKNTPFDRDAIVRYLEESNIQTRLLFAGNLIKQPCFDVMRKEHKGYRVVGELSNTDYVMANSFWVGVYPGLNKQMLEIIIKSIKEYIYRKR